MKEPNKAQLDYIKNNFNSQTPKELSDNTGLTVAKVKAVIKAQEDVSIEDIVKKHMDDKEEKKKKKKILKYGVSEDGNSVVLTLSQSMMNDEVNSLKKKNDFLKRHSKDIGIIKPKDE